MSSRALLLGVLIVGNSGLLLANSQRGTSTSGARAEATDAKALPPTLAHARTAFLIDEAPPGGETDLAFREMRALLHTWNRFEVVDRADRADVTISLSSIQVERVAGGSGAPIGAGFVNPAKNIAHSTVWTLTVRQRATGVILWTGKSETVTRGLQRLQQDMPRGPTLCIVFWCSR